MTAVRTGRLSRSNASLGMPYAYGYSYSILALASEYQQQITDDPHTYYAYVVRIALQPICYGQSIY
jgi:hypothetical protein